MARSPGRLAREPWSSRGPFDLCAARRPITEVAAIGDDVDLRHRHRHAARETRNAEQDHQRVGRNAEIARGTVTRRLRRPHHRMGRCASPQRKDERKRCQYAEDPDAEIGVAPAVGRDRMLQHRRPQRTADIVAGGRHPDRDPAMAHEPLRHVGLQRPERRRGADTNEQVHQRERERARNKRGTGIADADRQGAQHDRDHDAEAVA
jgi:hypothetical protein